VTDVRKIWFAPFLGLIAMPAVAHDFWVQPRQFTLANAGPALLTMFVGHGAARDRWGVDIDHVVLFRTIGPDGMIDRKADLRLGSPGFDALVPLAKPGGYVVVLQSTETPSQLPFLRFNDYVKTEGITPIIATRQRLGLEKTDGREVYSRRAKAIVQVGPVNAASIARVTRPTKMLLEIVPGKHPQALGADRMMPVQVLFQNRPLAGALVKITDLAADAEPVATQRTDKDGRTSFRIPRAGKWQMNVVWSVPEGGSDPLFRTTFSSLTFATP
jgi:hypothetical protein